MELDAPRTAEPERLRADRAAGQLDGPLREVVRVVVPLEGVEPLRQGCRDRIAGAALGQLDLEPADLGLGGPEDTRTRCAGDQLRAEADAEQRRPALELPLEEAELRRKPRVTVLLIGMHGAAEHDRGVGALVGHADAGDVSLDELVPCGLHGVLEDAWADVVAVREREDPHAASLPSTVWAVADTHPPYNPADGRAADRRVRLGRRRPDGAARVPGDTAARGFRLSRRRRPPALRPASAGRAAPLRP